MKKIVIILFIIGVSFCGSAQSIKLIPNNDTADAGFSNKAVTAYNNGVISFYTKANGKTQLAHYTAGVINYINNPDTGGTMIKGTRGIIIFKNKVYYAYKNNSGDTLLGCYDGNSNITIANPNSNLIPNINSLLAFTYVVNNNRLFLAFLNKTNKKAIAVEYDGTSFKIYKNPSGSNFSVSNLFFYNDTLLAEFNNTVFAKSHGDSLVTLNKTNLSPYYYHFFPYVNVIFNNEYVRTASNANNEYNVVLFNGDSTVRISNPNWAVFTSEIINLFPVVFNNNIYRILKVSQSGKKEISKYDGLNYSRIFNPDTSGTTGNYVVKYNNSLFCSYKKKLSQSYYELASLKDSTFSFINLPDTAGDYYPNFTFDNKLHLIYFYKKSGSSTTYKKIAFCDSSKITKLNNPDTGIGFTQYYDTVGRRIYFTYQNAANKFQLGYIDFGDTTTADIAGNIITPKNNLIKKVSIRLLQDSITSIISDENGRYNFTLTKIGNYTIRPTKNNDILKANGINATDVLFIQRHILNTAKLNSPYKLIAADVNGDGVINPTDVLRIKRLILGTDTTFTKGSGAAAVNRLWAFVDSAYVFSDTTNPFPFKDSISFTNLTSNKTNQTFIGIKLGDVNYDWNPAVARAVEVKPVELVYSLRNEELGIRNSVLRIPITVKNFKELVAMQYTLHFNNKNYEFVGIENNKFNIDFNEKQVTTNGNIAMLWTDQTAEAKTLEDGIELFTIVLKQKELGTRNLELGLALANDITDVAAFDKDLIKRSITLTKQQTPNDKTQTINELFSIYPNPAHKTFNVKLDKLASIATVVITDVYGNTVLNKIINQPVSTINNLAKGVYMVSVTTDQGKQTKKVVVE